MSQFQVGDRVRVRKPADVERRPFWVDQMDRFDGTVQVIRQVRTSDEVVRFDGDPMNWNFHFDWLEPVKPKTLNVGDPVEPIRSWVPDGYSVVEIALPDVMAQAIGEGNALVWKKPAKAEDYIDISIEFCPVIVPTTPPAPQYREPTQEDVGKMVEVRESETNTWKVRELLAVIDDKEIEGRFTCRDAVYRKRACCWDFAQIRIEESK